MHRILFLLLSTLLLCQVGYANDSRLQALLKAGQQRLHQQRFFEAEAYFLKALELDDQNAEAHYHLANCKRHRFHYAEALALYQAAQRLDALHFPLAPFYVALMQKQTGLYREAHQTFEDFIRQHTSSTTSPLPAFVAKARREIQGIELSYQLALQSPSDISFQRLPSPVNSSFHDYAAQVLQHDSSLLISSARPSEGAAQDDRYGEYMSNLFLFEKGQQQWNRRTSPEIAALNSALNEGSGVFNRTQDQFYFTACYQDSTCRIMISMLVDDAWSVALSLNRQINLPGYTAKHPALSPGGDTLYFASNRPGGYGQFDLWMSVRQADQAWQSPINLGPAINTANDEVSPHYYANEHTLLFSSNGHISIGGYDLYAAPLRGDHSFETPTNLGLPFNSSQDDLYLHVGHQQAFLTSNRNNEDGNFDLYTFRMRMDDGNVALQPEAIENWYELQFSSAEMFAPEDRTFYEQLPLVDKVKATHYIKRQSFQEAVSQHIEQTDTASYRYESLSGEEQALVQRLTRAKKQFVQKELSPDALVDDYHYYENLPTEEKEKINQLVDQQWFRQLLQESGAPGAEAVFFYEKLPPEDQQKVRRAIQEQQLLHYEELAQQPTLEDIFYYQALPTEEKETIEQMIAAQQFVQRVWEAEQDEELHYVYEQLAPDEQSRIQRYVNRQSFQLAMEESSVLSPETTHHYETLDVEEKESVRRLARAKKQFLMKEPMDAPLPEDRQFYESLPPQEKETITRVIDAQVFALLVSEKEENTSEDQLTLEKLPTQDQQRVNRVVLRQKEFHQRTFDQLPTVDKIFEYQALSDEEKVSVQRLATTRQFATRPSATSRLDEEATLLYEKLPRSDQESVDRLVDNRKKFLLKGEPESLSAEDQYFLETLTTEEKQQVRRIVEARVFDELLTEETQTTQLAFRYQNLGEREQQQVNRLARSQRLFAQVAEEDASTPPDHFSLQKIAARPSDQVDIQGRISSRRSKTFPERVFLVNDLNDTLATASVSDEGTFTFTTVKYQENHRVVFQQQARSFTQLPDYQLEELSVISQVSEVEPKKDIHSKFSNIYFATNQYELPASARSILDSVVYFHQKHPQVPIELRAFADSTGSRTYNLELTRRRARSVQAYLLAHGIAQDKLSQVAGGSLPDDDLAFCRRVEVVVGATTTLPSSVQTIYVIQAQPDLSQIADRYQVPLDKLKEWNVGNHQPPPYTPIRVMIAPTQ